MDRNVFRKKNGMDLPWKDRMRGEGGIHVYLSL